MNLQEINTLVFKGNLSPAGLENMKCAGVLPPLEDVPVNEKGKVAVYIREWKNTFVGCFVSRYPRYYGIIVKIKQLLGHAPTWDDFTKANIDDIMSLFSSCSPSSTRTYAAMLKAVLNDGKDEYTIPCARFCERLSIKGTPSVNVYLNLEELSKLENYHPINEKESIILAQFLIGCYTGARHSDILDLTPGNIRDGYISYVSKKTNIAATIEAKPILSKLLPIAGKRNYVDACFNDTIRAICRKCGIDEKVRLFRRGKNETGEKWEFIASHTARRSFATNLAELGVPLLQIAKRMGHSDIKMTQGYICSGIGKLSGRAISFFQ